MFCVQKAAFDDVAGFCRCTKNAALQAAFSLHDCECVTYFGTAPSTPST